MLILSGLGKIKLLKMNLKLLFNVNILLALIGLHGCKDDPKPIKPDITFLVGKWKVTSLSETGTWQDASTYTSFFTFYTTRQFGVALDVNVCGGGFDIPEDGKITISWDGCTKTCCDGDYGKKIIQLIPEMNNYLLSGKDTITFSGSGQTKIKLIRN